GDGTHDVFDGGVAELDDGVLKFGARLLLQDFGFLDLVGAKKLFADKDIGEVSTVLGHYELSVQKSIGRCIRRKCDTRVTPGTRVQFAKNGVLPRRARKQ